MVSGKPHEMHRQVFQPQVPRCLLVFDLGPDLHISHLTGDGMPPCKGGITAMSPTLKLRKQSQDGTNETQGSLPHLCLLL